MYGWSSGNFQSSSVVPLVDTFQSLSVVPLVVVSETKNIDHMVSKEIRELVGRRSVLFVDQK